MSEDQSLVESRDRISIVQRFIGQRRLPRSLAKDVVATYSESIAASSDKDSIFPQLSSSLQVEVSMNTTYAHASTCFGRLTNGVIIITFVHQTTRSGIGLIVVFTVYTPLFGIDLPACVQNSQSPKLLASCACSPTHACRTRNNNSLLLQTRCRHDMHQAVAGFLYSRAQRPLRPAAQCLLRRWQF